MRQKRSTVNALAGTQRGDLSIIRIDHLEPRTGNIWLCRCKCGKEVLLPTNRLMSGTSRSCPDCAKRKSAERTAQRLTTHGLSNKNHRLYAIWKEIISRCTYQGDTIYRYYGGAGITVCDEWEQYPPFYEWALSHGYSDDLTIDRIDNSKGYCPENCRWADRKIQAINHSNARFITVRGITMCLADWSRALGVCRQTIYQWRKFGIAEDKISRRFPKELIGDFEKIYGMNVLIWRGQ